MKAAPFDYHKAQTLDEVCALLAQADGGEERMILAGGQTLVPLMAMRFARPALLIDINDVAELSGIDDAGDAVVIRACTRQADALASTVVRDRLPLLAKALPFVGHQQTRNRGTVGGSIALGDPSAEIPLTAAALEARIVLRGPGGARTVSADDFFVGAMSTARDDNECLVEVSFPVWNDGKVGAGFHEVAERHGDFAVVAAAAQVELDDDGVCRRAALSIGGANPVPVKIRAAESALLGKRLDRAAIDAAVATIGDAIHPSDDGHASAAYRRRVAPVLAARALADAVAEAQS